MPAYFNGIIIRKSLIWKASWRNKDKKKNSIIDNLKIEWKKSFCDINGLYLRSFKMYYNYNIDWNRSNISIYNNSIGIGNTNLSKYYL